MEIAWIEEYIHEAPGSNKRIDKLCDFWYGFQDGLCRRCVW
jgi:hypothetical protein